MLAGSACKQDVHRADGLKLVELVNRFAEIYWTTKDIKVVRKPTPYPPNLEGRLSRPLSEPIEAGSAGGSFVYAAAACCPCSPTAIMCC